jgi:hypothetical protein
VGDARVARLLRWLLLGRAARGRGDYALLASLPLLALLAALLLTWPWLSGELPRHLAAGLEGLRALLLEWSKPVLEWGQRLTGPLAGGEP